MALAKLRLMLVVLAFLVCMGPARADSIYIGFLSFDLFIPADDPLPGVNAVNIGNFTGPFNLPGDFPVADSLTFHNASLTLFPDGLPPVVTLLGDIGPGTLSDSGGNPVVQVPSDQLFTHAEFMATLAPLSFTLFDGTTFIANSSILDVLLMPSSGSTLVAGADFALISVDRSTGVVPEPVSVLLLLSVVLAVLPGLARACRLRRSE